MQKSILLILILLNTLLSISAQETDKHTTTYYLIRHAEKVRDNQKDPNPDLNERGLLRAQKWEEILQFISFDAIYSTDFKRTLKTVEPIAISNELEIQKYHPIKLDFEEFKKNTIGKNVLIVGHSNTIPQFTNTLIGKEKYPEIDDAEFSHLYIITIIENQITDLFLYIDF